MRNTAPCLQNDAPSCSISEKMAALIRGDRVLRSGDSFSYPVAEPSNFPSPRVAAVCAFYRHTGGLGSVGGLDLRQTIARSCECIHAKKRGISGRGHRLLRLAAFCPFVRNYLCLHPTGY
jgi:hypothetical protein